MNFSTIYVFGLFMRFLSIFLRIFKMNNYVQLCKFVIANFIERVFSATWVFGLFMRIFKGMVTNGYTGLREYYRFVILSDCLRNCQIFRF